MNSSLTLEQLSVIYPNRLLLEFSERDRETIWQQTQAQNYSNAWASWNAFLNNLCLKTFLKYLKTEDEVNATFKSWKPESELSSFWQVVNGSCIEIERTKLILIPSENSFNNELRVPQEWVDIPDWAGDYFIAVDISLEEGWMQVGGYANYQQLRQEGQYDAIDATYSLDASALIEDLLILWTMREPHPMPKSKIVSLPSLTATEAEMLLKKVGQPSNYSPRLSLPFEEWGALIKDDRHRKKLYELQQQKTKTETKTTITNNLGQWLQNIFESGWQSLETFVSAQPNNLAYGFRQKTPNLEGTEVEAIKTISLKERSLVLSINLKPEDEKVSIIVRLSAFGDALYLPPNLDLKLLSKSGKMLQEVESREEDRLIQLKRFIGAKGQCFTICLSHEEFSLTEDFTIDLYE
jgi:hypothetical protein